MFFDNKFKALVSGVIGAVLLGGVANAQEHRMRISLDTGPATSRVEWVQRFAEAVEERSGGRIRPEMFHSGQLFRDSDVARAIRQGNIEMAVPGTWQLGGFDPRLNIFQLPVMYGRAAEEVNAVVDGPVGQMLAQDLAQQLGVVIIGSWMDLDSGSVFTTTEQINSHADFEGLTIRYPGGAAIEERLRALGATPVHVPFPDVPLGLQRGNFNGMISTANTIASAMLWESGIRFGYLEANSRDKFIPMVSSNFWQSLDDELRQIVTEEWARMIPAAREDIAARGATDEQQLEAHGIVLVRPDAEELNRTREILMAGQDRTAEQLGIPADFLGEVVAQFAATGG